MLGQLTYYLYLIPAILLALTVHELAHGYISYKLGDPTAKNMGRLTLNPVAHIDILGFIMLVVAGFGWAKPVPINPMYYKDKRKGTMLVALAGPVSNILTAFIFAIPMYYISGRFATSLNPSEVTVIIYTFCSIFVRLNIGLAVFNLIPVPPLDGSKILGGFLSPRQYYEMMSYEHYISLGFLFIVLVFPSALNKVLSPLILIISKFIELIAFPIARLFI